MQNELRAPRAGIVERLAVAAGQTIELGDLLAVLGPSRPGEAEARTAIGGAGSRRTAVPSTPARAAAPRQAARGDRPALIQAATAGGRRPGRSARGRPSAGRATPSSDIEIADLYTPADIAGLDEDRDLGRPGEYPFTRGVQPTMYRGRLWTMRQYAGFATADETNRRFRYLLEQGQTGLSVAFDLPTQMGYDSDAPEAAGEVGRVGVPISSLADMEALAGGIPLGEVSTSMTINSTAAILLALYVAAAESRGVPPERQRHHPERHPQGVHRPRHLHLPAAAVDAARDRRLRVRRPGAAALEHDLDLRLPHARGGATRRPGARLHAGRRDRLCRGGRRARPRRRRVRRPPELLLRRLERAVRGGRQVPRGAADVGPDHEGPLRRIEHPFYDVPVPRPDRRLEPDRAVDRQQRRPDDGPGPGRGPRRRPEPAHELARRGARAADRGERAPGAADPADPRSRGRGDRDARSAGRLVLRRDPDQRAGGGGPGLSRRDRRDGRHPGCHRGGLPAAPDPGVGVPRPAGNRSRRPDRRRCQPVPGRGRGDSADPADRSGRRAAPGGGPATRPRRATRPPGRRPSAAGRRGPRR